MKIANLVAFSALIFLANCKGSPFISGPMPITEANCNALWQEFRDVKQNSVVLPEAFEGESLVRMGFTSIENLGYDPDMTIRTMAFVSYGRSCVDLLHFIPSNLPLAVEKNMISPDTRKVFEERKKFPQWSEAALAFVAAVEQCEDAVDSPCSIAEIAKYTTSPGTEGLSKAIEKDDSHLISFGILALGCDDAQVMRMLVAESGKEITCNRITMSSKLSVNRKLRSEMLSARHASNVYLESQRQALGLQSVSEPIDVSGVPEATAKTESAADGALPQGKSAEYTEAYECATEALKDGYGGGSAAYCVGNSRDPSDIEMRAYADAERDFAIK